MVLPIFKNLNILVVDDEKSTVISVAFVLRHCGHAVDTVSDGGEALLRLKQNSGHYHLLITDHAMLQVSGLELVAELRATEFRGKIVVLSANLTQELRERYQALGTDCFLAKPFDLTDLRKTVDTLGSQIPS